ncbi:MAG: hypothetical protein AAF708_03725 [Deinococcota bacterium]
MKVVKTALLACLIVTTLASCEDSSLQTTITISIQGDQAVINLPSYANNSAREEVWHGIITTQENGHYTLTAQAQILSFNLDLASLPNRFIGEPAVIFGKPVVASRETAASNLILPQSITLTQYLPCAPVLVDGKVPDIFDKVHSELWQKVTEDTANNPSLPEENIIIISCDDLDIPDDASAEEILALREPTYRFLGDELAKYGVTITNSSFWLLSLIEVTMPLNSVKAVAARGDIQIIEGETFGGPAQ